MSPSPPFRGEREGPAARRREGEVGGATNLNLSGPLTLTLSPGRRGRGKFNALRSFLGKFS